MGGKRRLTHEEFMVKLIETNEYVRNGKIETRGQYVSSRSRIECSCKKHDVLLT